MNPIFERIAEIRDYVGVSNRAFSMSIGISPSTFGNYMQGISPPSIDLCLNILNVYTFTSAEWLLRGEGTMIRQIDTTGMSSNDYMELISKLQKENLELAKENGRLKAKLDSLYHNRKANAKKDSYSSSSFSVAADEMVEYHPKKKEE